MSGSAEFTIDASPFSDRGFDGEEGLPSDLILASTFEIWKVQYSIVQRSKYAPAGVFSPVDGLATSPDATVTFNPGTSLLAGAPWLFKIRCVVNNGTDKDGNIVDAFTADRIFAVRNPAGLRTQLQGEQYEYDPSFGASAIYDEFAAAMDGFATDVSDALTPAIVRFTSGTPTLLPNKINHLSGTVSAAIVPDAQDNSGLSIWVKKHNLGSINLTRSGSDVIDGATTYTMASSYQSVRLVADGSAAEWLAFA